MRLRRMLMATTATLVALAPVAAHSAEQGPGYVTSSPADGEKRSGAPAEVWIVFDMPLDPSSILRVFDECERRVDDGDILVAGNRISVGIAKTPSGHYQAHWKVRAPGGALGDGVGNIHFEVTDGEPCGAGHGHHGGGGGQKGGGGQHGGGSGQHSGSGGQSGSSGHVTSSGGHSMSGTTHTMADGTQMADHAMGGPKGKAKSNERSGDAGAPDVSAREIAAGAPGAEPVEGQAVLIALLICMLLGAAGGYVVRLSGRL